MAKKRKKKGRAKAKARTGTKVASPKYAGKAYDCRGKHVRSGRGRSKSARVFCAKVK